MKLNKYLSFLLFLVILSACQNKPEKPDLRGHWHVYFSDNYLSTWDIMDDSTMIFNINNYHYNNQTEGYGIWEADTIISIYSIYGENFKYELSNDTLYLKEVESIPVNDSTYFVYAGEIVTYAVRVDTSTCDVAKEYYGNLEVNIKLPISEKVTEQNEVFVNTGQVSYMDIGNPKRFENEFPRDTFMLQINDVFISYNQVPEFIYYEREKLPEVRRDSLIILMGIDKNTPAMVVDSIERAIHASYPTVDLYYACLPEKQGKMHKPIFISLKNEFAKPAEKPAAFLTFSVGADKQVEWTLQKHAQKAASQRYDLQTAEGKDNLKEIILQANQNKQPLGIRFAFAERITFQDYITAQTTIKQILEQTTD